jgi:predicted metal-binding membrane protein
MHDGTGASLDRELAPTWALLAVLGAIGWVVTVAMARDMGVGPGTMDTAFVVFLAAWVAMMGAMMLPAVGPAAARELGSRSTASDSPLARLSGVVPFALGFLAPWAVYGAAFFVALAAAGRLVDSSPDGAAWLGVAILTVAAVYQLTPAKRRALERCRAAHAPDRATGARASFAAGAREGAQCVGCCWALMTVLIAFGVMNIAVMVGLAAVIFGEKVLRDARLVTVAAAGVLLLLAVIAAVHHPLLSGLTPMPMMG